MGLKYIYAGYSKCGTKTMAEVFRILNFKVFDFPEFLQYCVDDWTRYFETRDANQKRKILQKMFRDVDVVTDLPCFLFWKELMDAFPEAKCIFWKREENSWFNSIDQQVLRFCDKLAPLPDWLGDILLKTLMPSMWKTVLYFRDKNHVHMTGETWKFNKNWKGEVYRVEKTGMLRLYRQHCTDVLTNCDKNKLLVLDDINCGWKVICDFVGKDIPDCDWPHKNKAGEDIDFILANPKSPIVQRNLREAKRRLAVFFGIGTLAYYLCRTFL